MEKNLTTILDRIEKIIRPVDTTSDVQQRAIVLCKVFDEEFTNLANVATSHVQKEYTNKLLNSMSANIRNDIEKLNLCIKALRQHLEEGKNIYAKCNLAHLHLQSFDTQLTRKIVELQILTKNFLKPN